MKPMTPGLDQRPLPSPIQLLALATRSALNRPIATFIAWPLTATLAAGGCLVPWLNVPFVLIALAPTLGSLPIIALAIVRRNPLPSWAPLLGFTRYERFLGLFWIPYLVAAGAAIPFVLGLWIERHLAGESIGPWVLGFTGCLSVGLLASALHRYLLAPFVAADLNPEQPLSRVLEAARTLLDEQTWPVLWRLVAIVAFGVSGAVVSVYLLPLTLPLAALAAAHFFVSLCGHASRPVNGEDDLEF